MKEGRVNTWKDGRSQGRWKKDGLEGKEKKRIRKEVNEGREVEEGEF